MRTVLLVNYTNCPINDHERKLIEERFGTSEIDYVVTRPKTIDEHCRNCAEVEPDIVLFTGGESSMLQRALEAGFLHVAVDPGRKGLMRIISPYLQLESL